MLVFSQRERDIFQARFQILWWSRSSSPIQRQRCFMSRHYLRDEDAFNRVGSFESIIPEYTASVAFTAVASSLCSIGSAAAVFGNVLPGDDREYH
jgi:hypothetical protein